MIKIGITGGIGSGKSTVCKVFESLGIPVNDADSLAKRIIVEDNDLRKSISENFGNESYLPDGSYNRTYIAQLVFNNTEKLNLLNQLVHPKVIEYSNKWTEQHQHKKYVIKEAALMFESGSYKYNDFNIVVESPLSIRIKRICKRDGISEEAALKRINAQWSDDERKLKSDLIILNNEKDSIIKQVINIHQNILQKNDPR